MRTARATPAPDYENQFLEALRKVARGGQGLIPVTEVRAAADLPKVVFDALALRLMREGKLTMHEHDFPESLPDARRAGLVESPKGRVFIGMALPPGQGLESKVLAKAKLYGPGVAVRIAKLRKDVSFSPTEFDIALGALQRLGKVALYRDDNRATSNDEGAYRVGGEPRHILYVKD